MKCHVIVPSGCSLCLCFVIAVLRNPLSFCVIPLLWWLLHLVPRRAQTCCVHVGVAAGLLRSFMSPELVVELEGRSHVYLALSLCFCAAHFAYICCFCCCCHCRHSPESSACYQVLKLLSLAHHAASLCLTYILPSALATHAGGCCRSRRWQQSLWVRATPATYKTTLHCSASSWTRRTWAGSPRCWTPARSQRVTATAGSVGQPGEVINTHVWQESMLQARKWWVYYPDRTSTQ